MADLSDIPGFNMGSNPPGTQLSVLVDFGHRKMLKLLDKVYSIEDMYRNPLEWARMQVYACETFEKQVQCDNPDFWLCLTHAIVAVLEEYPLKGS